MERLEAIGLLARPQKLDGDSGDLANRERGASSSIAVDLGEDEPGQRYAFMKLLRHADGVLAGHGVRDQQGLGGARESANLAKLFHHGVINMQPTGRVQNDYGSPGRPRLSEFIGHDNRRLAARTFRIDGNV